MNEEILLDKIIEIIQENILLKKENEYLKNKFKKSNIKVNDDIDALFNRDNFRFGDKPKTELERLQNMIDDFWRDDKSEKKVGVRNETKFRR